MPKNDLQFDWANVERLLSLCVDFKERQNRGETIDLKDAASKVVQAFGIDDLDRHVGDVLSRGLENGFGEAFSDGQAKELAAMFVDACQPTMELVFQYAQGEANPSQLINGLNSICADRVEGLQTVLQRSLGIPDGVADGISGKLGSYTVSVYCFAAACKIYQKAATDAQLAKERRIEIERLSRESMALLKEQRCEMEALVDGYLLGRLRPFSQGLAAMDEAVLSYSDDGFVAANSQLWELFDRKSQYKTALEFDDLMLSDAAFRL